MLVSLKESEAVTGTQQGPVPGKEQRPEILVDLGLVFGFSSYSLCETDNVYSLSDHQYSLP